MLMLFYSAFVLGIRSRGGGCDGEDVGESEREKWEGSRCLETVTVEKVSVEQSTGIRRWVTNSLIVSLSAHRID
jgi:hypothetical protein